MTFEETQIVPVKILGRDFKIKCPISEIPALEEAKKYVEQEMLTLREKETIISIDTVAIITALNIAHQLLKDRKNNTSLSLIKNRLEMLKNKIATAVKNW